jgi:hypothetical protein
MKEPFMASGMASGAVTKTAFDAFDIESITKLLECPVEMIPLTKAVSCMPCMHKINESTAQTLYGAMAGGHCSTSGQPCVICKAVVTAYYVDHSMRDLANRILGIEGSRKLLAELPTSSLILDRRAEEAERKEMPYPGIPAKFVHHEGNWTKFHSGSNLTHQICFRSVTADALISEFALLGYDDSISVMISFKNKKAFQNYLLTFDIAIDHFDTLIGSFKTKTHDQLKIIFTILCKNNEIPTEYLLKMRASVERGTP